jgi:hypothetical protein
MYLPAYVVALLLVPHAVCLAFAATLVVRQILRWRSEAKDVVPYKHAVVLTGDFVVFIIGLKFNHDLWTHFLRNPGPILRTFYAMPAILKELHAHPEYGCLSVEHTNSMFSNPTHIVQVSKT